MDPYDPDHPERGFPPVFIPKDGDDPRQGSDGGSDRRRGRYDDWTPYRPRGLGESGEGMAITEDPDSVPHYTPIDYSSVTILYPEEDSEGSEEDSTDNRRSDDVKDTNDDQTMTNSREDDPDQEPSSSESSSDSSDSGSSGDSFFEDSEPVVGDTGGSRSGAGDKPTSEKPTTESHTEGRYDPFGGDQRVQEVIKDSATTGRKWVVICDSTGRYLLAVPDVNQQWVKQYIEAHFVAFDNSTVIFQVFEITPPIVSRYLFYLDGRKVTYEKRNNDQSAKYSILCSNVYYTSRPYNGGNSSTTGGNQPGSSNPGRGGHDGTYAGGYSSGAYGSAPPGLNR